MDDASGYQSIHDAIVESQHIGLCFLGHVKPQNLFFFFGETVKSLQHALMRFASERSIPYGIQDFFAPIYSEQSYRHDQCDAEPLAVFLCKVMNTQEIRDFLREQQQAAADDSNCYQLSWPELERLERVLHAKHSVDPSRPKPEPPSPEFGRPL